MNNIAIVYLPNISADDMELLLALSMVGFSQFVSSGATFIFSRLRIIDRVDLIDNGFSVWDFPERNDEESDVSYQGRLQAEVTTTLNILKAGAKDVAFISEKGFQQLNQVTEFSES